MRDSSFPAGILHGTLRGLHPWFASRAEVLPASAASVRAAGAATGERA